MDFHQHHFQQHLQPPQPPPPPPQSRDMYNRNIDGQITPPPTYFNGQNLTDQSRPPPFQTPFNVVAGLGLAPGQPTVDEGGGGGVANNLLWKYMLEPNKKIPKERDFSIIKKTTNNNNNSQKSSVDYFGARSVPTGLELSLEPNYHLASSCESSGLLGIVGDDFKIELRRQDAELGRYIAIQGEQLRQVIIEKLQANQMQVISTIEEKVAKKLREKDLELEAINKKNNELENRTEQLVSEALAWQNRAKYNENMINTLKFNLQQAYALSRDSKEGCGDSEIDDTASCCNGKAIDFHLLSKDRAEMKEKMSCKVCKVEKVCMLLLPCKHLCLCKVCESKVSVCPVCQSSKYIGMEVYM